MNIYEPHKLEVPPQAKDYKVNVYEPHKTEVEIFKQRDQITVQQATKWLEMFWWNNRKPINHPEYARDLNQANWETDRLLIAILNLKS